MEVMACIHTKHIAIVDAVMTLSRTRTMKNGPALLERPREPIFITTDDAHGSKTQCHVIVTCATWRGIVVTLELHANAHGDWLAWGPVTITNGFDSSTRKRVELHRYICPSFTRSLNGQPMRLRVLRASAGPR